MQGQANHFVRYSLASEPIPYAIDRYKNETRRLYRTVDTHLKTTGSDYLVGDKLTIADIALWCWVNSASKHIPPIHNYNYLFMPCYYGSVLVNDYNQNSLISTLQNSPHYKLGTRDCPLGQLYRRVTTSRGGMI